MKEIKTLHSKHGDIEIHHSLELNEAETEKFFVALNRLDSEVQQANLRVSLKSDFPMVNDKRSFVKQ
jgi:hypothetical protein